MLHALFFIAKDNSALSSARLCCQHLPSRITAPALSLWPSLLFFLWCTPLAAADDLWTLYRLALNNDSQYQKQQLERIASRTQIPIARSRFGPVINAVAGGSRVQGVDMSNFQSASPPDITYRERSYGLELTQQIYKPADITLYQQAKMEGNIADLMERNGRYALLMRVAERYFQLLSATDNVSLAQSEMDAIASQLQRARERFGLGLGAETAVHEARVRLELARVAEIQAMNEMKDAHQGVVELVDVQVQTLVPLAADAKLAPPQPQSAEQWVVLALEKSLDINIAKKRGGVAKKEIRRLKREVYPNLSLGVVYSYSDNEAGQPQFNPSRRTRATISFAVPLYSSGYARNRLSQATINYQVVQANFEIVQRAVERNVRAAYQNVTSTIGRVDALASAVEASGRALRARRDEYDTGLSTNVDVLNAQNSMFSARRDYLRARYSYILAYLRLKQLSGVLVDKDVQNINALLDTGANTDNGNG